MAAKWRRCRAVHGVDRPVFCQGRIIGYTKEYSDYLSINRRRPRVEELRRQRVGAQTAKKHGRTLSNRCRVQVDGDR
jgi:hypothetical protein